MSDDVLTAWATHLYAEGKAKRTVQDRITTMRRFERDSGRELLDATTADIASWLARPELSSIARSVYHSMFCSFYRWTIGQGLRVDSPMVTIKAAKRPKNHPRPITVDQFIRMRDNADNDNLKAMVLLAGLAGLRVHEIAKFRAADLDVEASTVEVCGKGGAQFTLPAHRDLIEHARRMPAYGYWFPSQRAKHLGGREVTQRLRLHMIRQHVPGTPHCLRHYFATQLVSNGADLRVVQELMRHSSLQTTARYTQVCDARKRTAIDLLA